MGTVSIPPHFSDYLMPYATSQEKSLEMSSDFPRIGSDIPRIGDVKEVFVSNGRSYSSPVLRRKCSNSSVNSDSLPATPPSGASSRRVSFADEVGQDLVSVRVYPAENLRPNASHNSTPRRALSLDMRPSMISPTGSCAPRLAFDQPAADFKTFMHKLKDKFIALDNIIVTHKSMFGTVKVKNICYAKEVFVRCTFDRWVSYTDVKADYVPCCPSETTNHPYDTFLFDTTLSTGEGVFHSIEFAICMKANNQDYWDNNNDKNYTILFDLWLNDTRSSYMDSELKVPDRKLKSRSNKVDGVQHSPTAACRMRRNFCVY